MKKIILPVFLAALMLVSACSQNKPAEPQPAPAEGSQIEYINTFNDDSEETLRINAFNVAVVTKAYPLETTDNTLKVIIDHLHTLHSGMILSAETAEENGSTVLDVVAENGTPYRFYFDEEGNVDSVKNMTTNEIMIEQIKNEDSKN